MELITVTIPELNIICTGEKLDEVLANVKSEVEWLKKEYVEPPDSGLSLDAIELKNRLINCLGLRPKAEPTLDHRS